MMYHPAVYSSSVISCSNYSQKELHAASVWQRKDLNISAVSPKFSNLYMFLSLSLSLCWFPLFQKWVFLFLFFVLLAYLCKSCSCRSDYANLWKCAVIILLIHSSSKDSSVCVTFGSGRDCRCCTVWVSVSLYLFM